MSWPDGLAPGALRFAWRARRYAECVRFYQDGVGLPLITSFTESFGNDGHVFGLPDSRLSLELLRAKGEQPGTEDAQLVLYLRGADAVAAAASRLAAAGHQPVVGEPYWEAHGALTFADPDGRALILAPWVFGAEPPPQPTP